MILYQQALMTLLALLDAVGEKKWRPWIAEDLHLWRSGGDTRHHLLAYNSLSGSLSDLFISRQAGHKVTEDQEIWIQALCEWLKSTCFFLASNPKHSASEGDIRWSVGRTGSTLVAQVMAGSADATQPRGAYIEEEPVLQGWRCQDCKYMETTPREVDMCIADRVVSRLLFDALESSDPEAVVQIVLKGNFSGLKEKRQEIGRAALANGITLRLRQGWMRPCPRCSSRNTIFARWRLRRQPGK